MTYKSKLWTTNSFVTSILLCLSATYAENQDEIPQDLQQNVTNSSNNSLKLANCLKSNHTIPTVHLLNDTELIKHLQGDPNVTDKESEARCIAVLFYSKYCPFSALAVPHYNALPRIFPDLTVLAINAMMYHLFNTQNGIVGVPSLLLFHNGKTIAKFNQSEYSLDEFSRFILKHTNLKQSDKKLTVTSADFNGPVQSMSTKDHDVFLILSWLFILLCGSYYFSRSKWCKWIIESIKSNWRESEAQHEHVD